MARKKPNAVKSEAYECGVEPTSDVAGRFPVRFYLIAMLFVISTLRRILLSLGGPDASVAYLRPHRDGVVRYRARDRIRIRVETRRLPVAVNRCPGAVFLPSSTTLPVGAILERVAADDGPGVLRDRDDDRDGLGVHIARFGSECFARRRGRPI